MSERPGDSRQRVVEQPFEAGGWELELSTRAIVWSQGARRLLELDASAPATFRALFDRIHPDDRARAEALYEQALNEHAPFDVTHRLLFPGGHSKRVRHAGFPLDADGEPAARYCGVLEDVTERARADREARRFREMVEHSSDIVVIVDADGWVTFANPAFETVLGYPRHLRIAASELIAPDDLAAAQAIVRQSLGSPSQPLRWELRFVHEDGSLRWLQGVGVNYLHVPAVAGFIINCRDQTPSDSEIEPFQSDELLQQAVRASGIGIFDHDQVKDTIYWSPRQREIHGLELEEALTLEKCAGMVHPDDIVRIGESVRHAHDPRGAGVWEVEYRIVRRDGSMRWLVARARTFFQGQGAGRRPVRTIGAVLDLTERKLAEEALRLKDKTIATSLNATAIMDEAGHIIYANPAFVRMSGYASESEIVRRSPEDFTDTEAAQHLLEVLREVGHFQGELNWRRQNGTTFAIILTANALRDADGKLTNLIASFLDVSDTKRMQEQLYQAQKMESVGRLAGGIAHDFNNLLTVMRGHLDLAVLDLSPKVPLRLDLDEVLKAVSSATSLTQQLLSFSRGQVITPQLLDLNAVVERVQKMLARVLGEDIALCVERDRELWPVLFDAGQFEQILINLAANARDAMPTGGRLLVETENVRLDAHYAQAHPGANPGEYVLLAVTDEGSGMSKDVQGHIFEPFYTTKQPGLGTGLGLAMVYGAVKQNNGRIEVYSEVGHGTCFKIYLPRAWGKAESLAIGGSVAARVASQETIVLVEDEANVRTLATRLLHRWGFKVHAFADGPSAIDFAATTAETLHLLVTDVVMPGMNGRDLAEKLLVMRPEMRVLFTSGYTANVIVHHGVLGEGVEFLPKPYAMDSLGKRIREVLDKPGMGRTERSVTG
jgi:PAS domain S-box-containing protein